MATKLPTEIEDLISHALETMPESVNHRRKILHAIIKVLPERDQRRRAVGESLEQLNLHIASQADLPGLFGKTQL